jgi:hypothetical protein
MNAEFKRMMELAGLAEIKVNHPISHRKLNLPPDFLKHADIPISIPELEENYNDLINDLVKLNPQIDPYFFQANNHMLWVDVIDSIYYDHPNGATIRQFYKIYLNHLLSYLIHDPNKYTDEEIKTRQEKFDYPDQRQKFANDALEGKWLNISSVTS